MAQPAATQTPNPTLGRLLSLLVIPVGVALWVLLWNWGFMASIVSFAIAYGAVWLFQFGAKTTPSRGDAFFLMAVILVGVIAAFVGGMISDAWQAWKGMVFENASFFSAEFWSFVSANLFNNSELWGSYMTDILIALVFGALGAGPLIKNLVMPPKEPESPQE